jgi:hypothetical protein
MTMALDKERKNESWSNVPGFGSCRRQLSPGRWRRRLALVREVQAAIHVARRSGLGAGTPAKLIIINCLRHCRIQSVALFLSLKLATAE